MLNGPEPVRGIPLLFMLRLRSGKTEPVWLRRHSDPSNGLFRCDHFLFLPPPDYIPKIVVPNPIVTMDSPPYPPYPPYPPFPPYPPVVIFAGHANGGCCCCCHGSGGSAVSPPATTNPPVKVTPPPGSTTKPPGGGKGPGLKLPNPLEVLLGPAAGLAGGVAGFVEDAAGVAGGIAGGIDDFLDLFG